MEPAKVSEMVHPHTASWSASENLWSQHCTTFELPQKYLVGAEQPSTVCR